MTGSTLESQQLIRAVQELSRARSIAEIQEVVRTVARALTGADGATFVLREGNFCHYADEDAIAPLWKGQRFPIDICVSGWAMTHRRPVAIRDIYADARVPHEAYRPTFVKSLALVPIRTLDPVGAIGNYWASSHEPTPQELQLLQALADSTAVAMENVHVYEELESARLETLHRLALAAEYRDDTTHEHTARVARTAVQVAERLGLSADAIALIRDAAPLHDIGKLSVPDAVLLKPGDLSADEFAVMKGHTTAGAAILAGSRSEVLRLGEEIALSHHEWWDGNGYPNGLREDAIPEQRPDRRHRRRLRRAHAPAAVQGRVAARRSRQRDPPPDGHAVRAAARRGVRRAGPCEPRQHRPARRLNASA